MGDTWRFQWAAQWQSGDSFLSEGREKATISVNAGWGKTTLVWFLFLFFFAVLYICMDTGVNKKRNLPLAQRVVGTIVDCCESTNACEYANREAQANARRQKTAHSTLNVNITRVYSEHKQQCHHGYLGLALLLVFYLLQVQMLFPLFVVGCLRFGLAVAGTITRASAWRAESRASPPVCTFGLQ